MNTKSSKRIISTTVFAAIIVLLAFTAMCTSASAATDEEIEQAIINGTAWLASQQNTDGSWGTSNKVALTAFALMKLEERAYELDKDPFDNVSGSPTYYEYADNVTAGYDFLLPTYASVVDIHTQTHGDPDFNNNGKGIKFGGTYYNGIVLSAISLSGKPGRDSGVTDPADPNRTLTFKEVAQDMVEYLAFGQTDTGNSEGGWYYSARDNSSGADNSNAGYAVLGLDYAEAFDPTITIPGFVKPELSKYIDYIQCSTAGSDYGGSGYTTPCYWVNTLKTGNLLLEMAFVGGNYTKENTPEYKNMTNATNYIERHWDDNNMQPGWRGNPAHYQAMYCMMKGFEVLGINTITVNRSGSDVDVDWFDEFTDVLVNQQNDNGSWNDCPCYVWTNGAWGTHGGLVLCTEWALLTVEKVSPPPQVITVYVDIKPGSCPNPLNKKSKGVLPVAVLGTEDFDVMTIDPSTIQLSREGFEDVGVVPIRWSYEDVATPFTGELCDCHDLDGDGILDLTLKFSTQALVKKLDLCPLDGLTIPLIITGNLKVEEGGTPIEGEDCIWVLKQGKK